MAIEDAIKNRITQLVTDGQRLSSGDEHGQAFDDQQLQECSAWVTATHNAIYLIVENPNSPYRQKVDRIASEDHGWQINAAVGELTAVVRNLLADAEAGLLSSVADRARAETFDEFLDHSASYMADGRKNEAGVIAGVVFEDTLRRICRKENMDEKGIKLDALISELATRGELSAVKAKRARAAAHVRTKASHAQWDEFELEDVRATIAFTRELIVSKLDS